MEPYLPEDETPQGTSGSASTAAIDGEELRGSGSDNSQTATGDSAPVETHSISFEENGFPKGHLPSSSSRGEETDSRFRLGIEPGRWFAGSSGDVYELLDLIGSGSASTVYKCKRVRSRQQSSDFACNAAASCMQQQPSELLAVKAIDLKGLRLNRNFNHEMEKLRKEAQYLQTLRHPAIVRFIDYVESADAIFIVQEYLKGGELFYKIVEKGCLSEQEACFIAHQMLSAIVFMHNSKVIHRDIKPENILILDQVEDGFYRVKLADFGLAKTLANCGTQATTMVGTPQYWAPEVITCGGGNVAGSYGYEADLWSFGVCLYVFLGGTYPFDGAAGSIQQLVLSGKLCCELLFEYYELQKHLFAEIFPLQIFYHPWMTRWLCSFDRSRFHLPDRAHAAFRFMPPLPPLAPPHTAYPPATWQAEQQQRAASRRAGAPASSPLALDLSGGDPSSSSRGDSETVGGRKPSASGAVELHADSPDASEVAVGAILPGFVKSNEPIPPFHLPILLPLQLHLLLSVHLLLLSLRENQTSFLLAQKLQKELWSLQRCVHTAVGFFEVTATSAIEAVTDIIAMFDGGGDREDPAGAVEAVGELFAQVRRWTCEMQQQGERLGMRYGRTEASVSDLICCLVAAVSAPSASVPQQQASKHAEFDLVPGAEAPTGAAEGVKENSGGGLAKRQQPISEPTSVASPPHSDQKRALISPASPAFDQGPPKESGILENGVGLWGAGGSVARMDLLREFLASNIRRMLHSFSQPSREEARGEASSPLASEDKQLVDAGVRAWSQVGMPDPSVVTDEILDFLFLSTKTAASHARRMTQSGKADDECFVVGQVDSASRESSVQQPPPSLQKEDTSATNGQQKLHFESAPECSCKETRPTSESPPSKSSDGTEPADSCSREKGNQLKQRPDCAELSFLCGTDAKSSCSNNGALQQKIAVSRLQLRSLEKLRQVSYILTCVCSFWSNFDVILCRLLQLQQTTETLTKHARAVWINRRAHKRLEHLRDCWAKFRTQCRIYLQLSNARNAKLMDLGLQVQLRADQLDAIRALHGAPDE